MSLPSTTEIPADSENPDPQVPHNGRRTIVVRGNIEMYCGADVRLWFQQNADCNILVEGDIKTSTYRI